MELPHLGEHCSVTTCNMLDFLPVRCDACSQIFCKDHFRYQDHNCPTGLTQDTQVPVCPLCNCPVPSRKGSPPDIAVSQHIDNDCKSDATIRKAYTNQCSKRGCKQKEVIPITCSECGLNYCLKHRHTQDHDCKPKAASRTNGFSAAGAAALARLQGVANSISTPSRASNSASAKARVLQGNMNEDEALARALQQSIVEEENRRRQTEQSSGSRRPDCSLS